MPYLDVWEALLSMCASALGRCLLLGKRFVEPAADLERHHLERRLAVGEAVTAFVGVVEAAGEAGERERGDGQLVRLAEHAHLGPVLELHACAVARRELGAHLALEPRDLALERAQVAGTPERAEHAARALAARAAGERAERAQHAGVARPDRDRRAERLGERARVQPAGATEGDQ